MAHWFGTSHKVGMLGRERAKHRQVVWVFELGKSNTEVCSELVTPT